MKERRTKDSTLEEIVCSGVSTIHGRGVFARRNIKKDEYIGTYHGPTVKRNGTHVLWVYEEEVATGRNGKNILRYLNHANPSNAEFDGFDLFARIAIHARDELTINYNPDEE